MKSKRGGARVGAGRPRINNKLKPLYVSFPENDIRVLGGDSKLVEILKNHVKRLCGKK